MEKAKTKPKKQRKPRAKAPAKDVQSAILNELKNISRELTDIKEIQDNIWRERQP